MNEVLPCVEAVVSPHGARRCVERIGGAHHGPDDAYRGRSADDHGADRTGGDEFDKPRVERFAQMLGVVAAGQFFAHHKHARTLDGESPPFEPADDLTYEPASDPVRLDQDQSAFHDVNPPGY